MKGKSIAIAGTRMEKEISFQAKRMFGKKRGCSESIGATCFSKSHPNKGGRPETGKRYFCGVGDYPIGLVPLVDEHIGRPLATDRDVVR